MNKRGVDPQISITVKPGESVPLLYWKFQTIRKMVMTNKRTLEEGVDFSTTAAAPLQF